MKLIRKHKIIIGVLVFLILLSGYYFYHSTKAKDLNVILITLDALRPDHLGCYGYKRNTSPNIDRLAREGILFTQAVAQTNWTGGSLATLLTSTYPSTHKIKGFGDILDKRLPTLAEILEKNNYYNIAANTDGGHFLDQELPGFGRGFISFISISEAMGLANETIDYLRKLKHKKFFIWLHLYNYPHAPFLPPAPYDKLFMSPTKNRHIPIGDEDGGIPTDAAVNNITDVDYYISQYDGEIAYADEQIGRILIELEKLDLAKNTIVVISADHGTCLDEHNRYFNHMVYLFEQLVKVPLIIRGPVIPPGKIINQQVQLIDLTPTILSLLKIKVAANMEGTSLLPLIFGGDYHRLYAFSQSENQDLTSIRTRKWKLIYCLSANRYELYDLINDPEEKVNLADIKKEKFELLKAKLEEWMNRPKPDITPLSKPLDEETQKRLRSLGYLH